MKEYYIAVKMRFVGELYTVSGPYDTFEEAENDLDIQSFVWEDNLDEDEYLGIVVHDINETPIEKSENKSKSANTMKSTSDDLTTKPYSQGHHLLPWILFSIFSLGIGIPFIVYYSVSPNHHWE